MTKIRFIQSFDANLFIISVVEETGRNIESKQRLIKGLAVIKQLTDTKDLDLGNHLSQLIASDPTWVLYASEVLDLFIVSEFQSYGDLYDDVGRSFYKLFSLALEKCEYPLAFNVIDAFGDYISRSYIKLQSLDNVDDAEQAQTDLDTLENFATHLCKFLLNVLPASFQAQLTVLWFFQKMIKIEATVSSKPITIIPSDLRHLLLVNASAVTFELYSTLVQSALKVADKRGYSQNHMDVLQLGIQAQELYDLLFKPALETDIFKKPLVLASIEYKRLIVLRRVNKLFKVKNNIAFWHITRCDAKGQLMETPVFDPKAFETSCPNLKYLLTSVKRIKITTLEDLERKRKSPRRTIFSKSLVQRLKHTPPPSRIPLAQSRLVISNRTARAHSSIVEFRRRKDDNNEEAEGIETEGADTRKRLSQSSIL